MERKNGMSWIEIGGKVHCFVAHDKSHPKCVEIYDELERLNSEMMREGYAPDTSWVTSEDGDNENDESKQIKSLCSHSERLAIVFGLISSESSCSAIVITKNLRVCGDCHKATKFISRIRKRKIFVRDSNRWHHFDEDGNCSCGDYF